MRYEDIVDTYIKIEKTKKRLEMTDHLVYLFIKTPAELLDKVVNLTQGKLHPDFLGIELGIADKLAVKAISVGTGIRESDVNSAMLELGDLGLVAEKMVGNKKQMALFTETLDVQKAFNNFDRIAKAEGSGSQDLKLKLVAELLHDASPAEAKYIVRTLAGKLRLGIADMTILDALAYAFTPTHNRRKTTVRQLFQDYKAILDVGADLSQEEDIVNQLEESLKSIDVLTPTTLNSAIRNSERLMKQVKKSEGYEEMKSKITNIYEELKSLKSEVEESRKKIEDAYNICSDIGEVSRVLSKDNLSGLEKIKLRVGIPLRAMLAERLTSLSEIFEKLNGECAFEYKYDGLRIQAHIESEVQLFSRRLEDITDQFPDVQKRLKEAFKGKSAVVEGECVPVDINTGVMLPFQQVSHRRGRKYDIEKAVEEFPVVLYLFDTLYSDGRDYTSEPFPLRRKKLKDIFDETDYIKFSQVLITGDKQKAEDFFEESLASGTEGVIAKSISPDSFYRAGSRGWQWIKYKREYKSEMTDTADLVVIGAFAGRGRRAGVYGALLLASYNKDKDEFETVCKVGTGFSDKILEQIPKKLEAHKQDKKHPRVNSDMKADFWFEPNLVMEVAGAEITHSPIHTCAYGVIKSKAGLAIRFPRFTGNFRSDKKAEDATSSQELVDMYKLQLKQIEE